MFNFKMCKTGFKQICKHFMYTVYTKIVNINTLTETDMGMKISGQVRRQWHWRRAKQGIFIGKLCYIN